MFIDTFINIFRYIFLLSRSTHLPSSALWTIIIIALTTKSTGIISQMRFLSILEIGKHDHALCGINAWPFHGEFTQSLPADGIRNTRSGITNADATKW